jgi:hypothetical protein
MTFKTRGACENDIFSSIDPPPKTYLLPEKTSTTYYWFGLTSQRVFKLRRRIIRQDVYYAFRVCHSMHYDTALAVVVNIITGGISYQRP